MPATTSTHFASAIASGTDWRDTSKAVLEELEKARTPGHKFNFGFLYVSDYLADDLTSILNLFKSVLNIEEWVGSVGLGVCGNGCEHIDAPSISAMIGTFDEQDFCIFPPFNNDDNEAEHHMQPWLDQSDPMMIFTHGDPMIDANPTHVLAQMDQFAGGFSVGGLTSSRTHHLQIAGDVTEGGFSGVAFSQNIAVASSLSQGCRTIGNTHTITRMDDAHIADLDETPALDVFENDMRLMAAKQTNASLERIRIDDDLTTGQSDHNGDKKDDEENVFKGEVLAALPVSESDQGDYLVRNIVSIDEDSRSIDIAHPSYKGERIMFVYRDDKTVCDDLSANLVQMRERITRDQGGFNPKGALYISCVARAFSDFSFPHNTENDPDSTRQLRKKPCHQSCGEMALIRNIIGDVPLTGFYAAGEIKAGKLFGYSGILILFL